MRSRMKWKFHVRFCKVTLKVTFLLTFSLQHQKNQILLYEK